MTGCLAKFITRPDEGFLKSGPESSPSRDRQRLLLEIPRRDDHQVRCHLVLSRRACEIEPFTAATRDWRELRWWFEVNRGSRRCIMPWLNVSSSTAIHEASVWVETVRAKIPSYTQSNFMWREKSSTAWSCPLIFGALCWWWRWSCILFHLSSGESRHCHHVHSFFADVFFAQMSFFLYSIVCKRCMIIILLWTIPVRICTSYHPLPPCLLHLFLPSSSPSLHP